jgi:UDP-N-acetylglucosamine acyltransferase
MKEIHQTAIIHPAAELADGVRVGPYAIIGERVRVGRGTRVDSHAVIESRTEIGTDCHVFPFATIGTIPQDLKYKGEESTVVIGDRNRIREYVTIHRGTAGGGGVTRIGNENLLMAYVHVAHDCRIGNGVILANAVTLAGHIEVQDHAVIGGLSGLHQFIRIGRHAFIGGCSAVAQDVPPFVSAVGNRVRLYGINTVGLERHGLGPDRIAAIKKAYKTIFRSKLTMKEALKKAREESKGSPEVEEMVRFIETSERGVVR